MKVTSDAILKLQILTIAFFLTIGFSVLFYLLWVSDLMAPVLMLGGVLVGIKSLSYLLAAQTPRDERERETQAGAAMGMVVAWSVLLIGIVLWIG